jgi:ABC-type iron transport system FetAB ATPase subunit
MDGLCIENLKFPGMGPITLRVGPGACVGLSGPSGSGKTRLLRAVADMMPHTGEIFLDGAEANTMPAHQWRRRVGFLPAESAWWHERVGDHFPSPDADGLRQLGFSPDVFSWEVSRLSSGERQRLALLRLLAGAPKALLLDEPTANLDSSNTARVEAMIAAYRRRNDASVIWVGHDPAQLRRVAAIRFILHGGNLVRQASDGG